MAFVQVGQAGAVVGFTGTSTGLSDGGAIGTDWRGTFAGAVRAACADRIIIISFGPSIKSTFRPLANSTASFLNYPDATTKPPTARLAAMTPYSLRTTLTPTLTCESP